MDCSKKFMVAKTTGKESKMQKLLSRTLAALVCMMFVISTGLVAQAQTADAYQSHNTSLEDSLRDYYLARVLSDAPTTRQARWFACTTHHWVAVRSGPGMNFHQVNWQGGLPIRTLVSGSTLPQPYTPGWRHILSPYVGYISTGVIGPFNGDLSNPRCPL